MQANAPTMTDIPCTACGRPMQIRTASTGVFLGCSGYALPPKERCKETINLMPGDEAIRADADDEAESRLLRSKHRCKLCNAAMDSYLIDESANCTCAATIRTARVTRWSRAFQDQGLRRSDAGVRQVRQ
jgi:ssDNA-binding Zn-finger/Zn-ribbon topoisomerase 1